MKLLSFTIKNYRSIIHAKKIVLGKKTVLVGPNNEGKSNILRALVTAMRLLTEGSGKLELIGRFRTRFAYEERVYRWARDFPISLQKADEKGATEIILEFEPTEKERDDLKDKIDSKLSGNLPLKITINRDAAKIQYYKRGRGAAALAKKSDEIAKFITNLIDFRQIEAVRTAESAEDIVSQMVLRGLENLERAPRYQTLSRELQDLQQPVLQSLSNSIKVTLQQFLPDIKNVKIIVPPIGKLRLYRRECEIVIDDGTETNLRNKGDGAQSLASLGIIRHASEQLLAGKNLVIAIEEPESHLHSGAIHKIRQVIDELCEKHQVLITTHNPLFVDRACLSNNILVRGNTAKPARSTASIRKALGVLPSDNLQSAEMVLIVEGNEDRIALNAILSRMDAEIKSALESSKLSIEELGGGTNLGYKISLIKNSLCLYHAFLDNDKVGRMAYDQARTDGYILQNECHFTTVLGRSDSEFEDLIDVKLYKDFILTKYTVSLDHKTFKSKHKWSDRVKNCFIAQGKIFDAATEMALKNEIAQMVAKAPEEAIHSSNIGIFSALIAAIKLKLSTLRN